MMEKDRRINKVRDINMASWVFLMNTLAPKNLYYHTYICNVATYWRMKIDLEECKTSPCSSNYHHQRTSILPFLSLQQIHHCLYYSLVECSLTVYVSTAYLSFCLQKHTRSGFSSSCRRIENCLLVCNNVAVCIAKPLLFYHFSVRFLHH